jgi:hypothetical protein
MSAAVAVAVAAAGLAYELRLTAGDLLLPIAGLLTLGVAVALVAIWVLGHWAQTAAVFVVVIAVAGSIQWLRTDENPKVRPIAAVRVDAHERIAALVGIFVAATKDDLFLARVRIVCKNADQNGCKARPVHETGDLVILARKDFREVAVGTSVPLDSAQCRALELLAEVLVDTQTDAPGIAAIPTARGSQVLAGGKDGSRELVMPLMPRADACQTPRKRK